MKEKLIIELTELPEDPSTIQCIGTDIVKYACPICNKPTQKAKRYIVWNGFGCHSCNASASRDYKSICEKRKLTWLEKYGTDNPSKTEEGRQKCSAAGKKSNELHPLNEAYQQHLDECLEKRKSTWTEKYGVDNPSKVKEIRCKMAKKYTYDNIKFDSAWEAAFYIYHKDLKHDVIYEPCKIAYTGTDNKQHYYFPDFSVNGVLYELKGYRYDESFHKSGKYKVACENDVKILYFPDIKPILYYVSQTYGSNYLKNLKNYSK